MLNMYICECTQQLLLGSVNKGILEWKRMDCFDEVHLLLWEFLCHLALTAQQNVMTKAGLTLQISLIFYNVLIHTIRVNCPSCTARILKFTAHIIHSVGTTRVLTLDVWKEPQVGVFTDYSNKVLLKQDGHIPKVDVKQVLAILLCTADPVTVTERCTLCWCQSSISLGHRQTVYKYIISSLWPRFSWSYRQNVILYLVCVMLLCCCLCTRASALNYLQTMDLLTVARQPAPFLTCPKSIQLVGRQNTGHSHNQSGAGSLHTARLMTTDWAEIRRDSKRIGFKSGWIQTVFARLNKVNMTWHLQEKLTDCIFSNVRDWLKGHLCNITV